MIRTLTIALALAMFAPMPVAFAAQPPKSPAAVRATSPNAPADASFGRFKYSAIGMRMKINALARAYRERWADDASIVHDAGLVESSYRAWAQSYPRDIWLAPTAYHLAQLYADVQSPDARSHARSMFAYVAQAFQSSKEGRSSRLRLQHGFPPLRLERPVSPTPSPYGPRTVSPGPSAMPATSPAGASPAPAAAAPSAAASPAHRASG